MQGKGQVSGSDLRKQRELLQKEYEYEKELYRQQLEQQGIERRIRQGMCWYPVHAGGSRYNSLNQFTAEVCRSKADETEHVFEYGRPVCFFRLLGDGSVRYFNFPAVVSYVRDNKMVVVLPGPHVLAELNTTVDLGVQLYFDDTSYKVMFSALQEVMETTEGRLAHLREVLSGNRPALKRDLRPLSFPWLNPSQQDAVNKVLAVKEVAVVHGPPGTGKTTTLVEAIFETLHREAQVMVCAQSNTAVDWISEKLTDRGINVLRIGNPTRVNDKMLAFTYERRFEAHPDYPELWTLRKAVREMLGRLRKGGRSERESMRNHLSKLNLRIQELEIRIDAGLFAEARVIACTLVGSANRLLEKKRFSSLFIDEAAQALEAACWIPIGRADRVILAGDHCQLPPTVKCPEALRGGLGKTLLEKVAVSQPDVVSLLNIQYRMNDDIMRFSSHWFYHDELQAAAEVHGRGILDFDTAVCWIDTTDFEFDEKCTGEGTGRFNTGEAELLIRQLKDYMERIGSARILDEQIDFGLISPYRAQVYYLRSLLKKDVFFRPFRHLISVHTVDGFQGQERDVILISLVRANEQGRIGFLGDVRRMNVAMTRARMKLLIFGDVATLTRHPFYKALYEYCSAL